MCHWLRLTVCEKSGEGSSGWPSLCLARRAALFPGGFRHGRAISQGPRGNQKRAVEEPSRIYVSPQASLSLSFLPFFHFR